MSAYLNKDGIYSGDRIVNYTTQGSTGARVNLGYFGAGGANYCHVKTSAGANGEECTSLSMTVTATLALMFIIL